MQPCALLHAGPCVSESPLAEEAVTQSWTPAAPHPRPGHRGHVEPAGPGLWGMLLGAGAPRGAAGAGLGARAPRWAMQGP